MENSKIDISTLSSSDTESIVQVVSLYNNIYSDNEKIERGLNSKTEIFQQISDGVLFVIAKEDHHLVGVKKVTKSNQKHSINLFGSCLYINPAYQKQGIGTKIDQFCDELVRDTKKYIFQLCGIDPENEASTLAHKKWGYKEFLTAKDPDDGKIYGYWEKEIEQN